MTVRELLKEIIDEAVSLDQQVILFSECEVEGGKFPSKKQSENMIYQVLKYIKECNLSDTDEYKLKIEIACSIISAVIDFEENNIEKTLENTCIALQDTVNVCQSGILNVLINKGDYKEI